MRTKNRQGKLKGEEAFTLVELLIVTLLMFLVVAAIADMIRSGAQASSTSYNQVKVEEAGGEALDTMIRQIRGATAIDSASTASLLIFAADLNGDSTLKEVRFGVSGGVLQKGSLAIANGPATLTDWIDGCDQFNLTYWMADDVTNQLNQVTPGSAAWTGGGYLKIARIDVQLQMSRQTAGGPPIRRTITGSVDLRNTLQDLF
jgi:competence protein ComGC